MDDVNVAADAGGGSNAHTTEHLFNACMQGGSRVHRLDVTVASSPTAAKYDGADTMMTAAECQYTLVHSVEQTDSRNGNHLAYGIDCIQSSSRRVKKESRNEEEKKKERNHEFVMASCSFYDNLVQIWSATT